jgi:hypothetical protein
MVEEVGYLLKEPFMNRLVIGDPLGAQLRAQDHVELCDQSGATIGLFLSEEAYEQLLCALSKTRISDEEIERRRQEQGGKTLAEIWERLDRS